MTDINTIQAIGTLVSSIGLPATVGVILVIAAWNLLPVLADYLRAKVALNHATIAKVRMSTAGVVSPAVDKATTRIDSVSS